MQAPTPQSRSLSKSLSLSLSKSLSNSKSSRLQRCRGRQKYQYQYQYQYQLLLSILVASLAAVSICLFSSSHTLLFCEALSLLPGRNVNSGGGGAKLQIELKLANIDNALELAAIQDCRRTAFPPDKKNFLNSERDFVAAKSVVDKKNLCVVAITKSKKNKMVVVIGTADLQPTSKGKNIVTNVFVRPDQRGNGIGRMLMVEGIEQILVPELLLPMDGPNVNVNVVNSKGGNGGEDGDDGDDVVATAVLSLDVYTQNKPAIELYLKLGYEPSSPIHAGTLALANTLNANLVVALSKSVCVPVPLY